MDRREQTVQPVLPVQDEISIREIIETLWKGKVIIALVTVVAVVLSAVISFFVLPEQYEAQAELLAKPFDISIPTSDQTATQNNIIQALTKLPSLTIEDYMLMIKSQNVLQKTIEKLELKDASGQNISTRSLAGVISVTNTLESNILSIKVSGQDPVQAALIANTLCQVFIENVTTSGREQIQQSTDLIEAQMKVEEINLNEKSKALTIYLNSNGSIDVLKGEISNLIAQIVNYKKEFRETETQIAADYETLKTLSSITTNTSGINLNDFQIDTNLSEDQTTVQDQLQLNLASDKLSAALVLVDINKIQTRLVSNSNRRLALQTKINEMNTALTLNQTSLTENEYKYTAIKSDLDLAQLSYDAFHKRYSELLMVVTADIGKTSITFTSEAFISEAPVSPNKMMNILIAAVLGLLLGAFIVLFMDYWKKGKVKSAA